MASSDRRKLYGITLLSGAVSILSYILVYTHQEWVTRNFTRGGGYAVLPIATAFYFALVHGTFTSCILNVLGIRAIASSSTEKKKDEVKPCPTA